MTTPEPRNPLYFLLLLASLLFVITALAYAFVPVLEEKAIEAGQPPPPSAFRDSLRANGGRWLLCEVGAVVILSIACMVVDRLRTLRKQRSEVTIDSGKSEKPIP